MKIAELKDRVVLGAARAYARRTMADYAERPEESQFEVTVARVVDLNPVMRRITLTAPELAEYRLLGPDEYFGLLMPGADGRLHLPDPERTNVRTAIADMPESEQPGLRWYTVRALRRDEGELDVDIVTHGDSGPGSAWATTAAVGDTAGAAKALAEYGLEARHLRAFKTSADREAGLIAQIANPVARGGDAGAAERAAELVREEGPALARDFRREALGA